MNNEERQETGPHLSEPSDDDVDCPQRLTADPDSPTSRLLDRIAQISLKDTKPDKSPEKRFSYLNDIARNPRLAQAARWEAVSGHSSPMRADGATPFAEHQAHEDSYIHHEADIDRQKEAIDALDRDAELESKLNQEMAHVMIGRVQSGRSSAEKVLSVLQAFSTAEVAYSKAMKALGGLDLPGPGDGATLRSALKAFVELPSSVGLAHEHASKSILPSINLVRDIVTQLRTACVELKQGSMHVQTNVDSCRKALKAALLAHSDVCKAFDATVAASRKSGGRSRSVELDPWVTEGRLVERQIGLQAAQASQRKYLAGAFRKVGELERQRISITRMALSNCIENMACSVSPDLQERADMVESALNHINAEADLDSFTTMAADSVKGGDSLSARQTETIDYLWKQLQGSSEIARQGEMKRLDPSRKLWVDGFGVLTRAGFLHWFETSSAMGKPGAWGSSGGPSVSINLARCEFEQGAAPSWRLIETASGGIPAWIVNKKSPQTYSTPDVESCMDWTAELREMISMLKGK